MLKKIEVPQKPLFSNQDLRRLILPLMIEQLLLMTVGMADTVMVTSAGEAVVSGVSLVDSINMLIIQVFSALSTGGAVVVSQYLGRREQDHARQAAAQLMYAMLALSIGLSVVALVLRQHILTLIFGRVDQDVMDSALVYFLITAAAYPMMAIYNAGAALFRAHGNSRVSMWCTLIINIINIAVNAIAIYGFHMGAAGAGLGTLVSRIAAAVIIMALLRSSGSGVQMQPLWPIRVKGYMVRSILGVGIPNGLENGMFHVGKLLVLNLITSFGTAAVAANAIGNSISSVTTVPGITVGLAMITVIGRCMGAQEIEQARYYVRKLMTLSCTWMAAMAAILFFGSPFLVTLFDLSPEAQAMAVAALRICAVGDVMMWPLAFTLPNALRAAGDTMYTMIVSQASMFMCRVACSYLFACSWGLGLGLAGVWAAMVADWVVRTVFFLIRYKRGRWQSRQVLR